MKNILEKIGFEYIQVNELLEVRVKKLRIFMESILIKGKLFSA